MDKKYFVEIVINKEKLSDGSPVFVAHCSTLGITSQGSNTDEAMANIKEAIELYLEEQPERYDDLSSEETPLFSVIEVVRNGKAANTLWSGSS
jgi:predicted RNase H-like HicB family nuclease